MRAAFVLPAALLLSLSLTPRVNHAASSVEAVTFHKQPTAVGEASQQTMKCDLSLNMSIRQAGQIVQEQQQGLSREQERQLTILQVAKDAPLKAEVKYTGSHLSLQTQDKPPQAMDQPVTGKTYWVVRDGEQLQITYPDGKTPPDDEVQVVKENMGTFGLPNPIAQFFDGRQVKVGQTLELPADLARDLLGLTETNNAVSQFQLKLVQVKPARPDRAASAVFDIHMRSADPQASGVSMDLTGQLTLEVNTCRSLAVSLHGPVVATETHGPENATYEVHTQGDIKVAVQASYLRR